MDITPVVASARNDPGSGFTSRLLGPAPDRSQRPGEHGGYKQALAALRRRRKFWSVYCGRAAQVQHCVTI